MLTKVKDQVDELKTDVIPVELINPTLSHRQMERIQVESTRAAVNLLYGGLEHFAAPANSWAS